MMSNEIKIFENEEFGQVRTVMIDNEPWFVGKDVAVILGYSNSRKAIADHVDDEDKLQRDEVTIRDSIGREQNPVIINESGVYSLILRSKLPNIKKFKRWVTSEVLPSIRKTGSYSAFDEKELALISIVNAKSDLETAMAVRHYKEIIEAPLLETIEEQAPMVQLAEERIDKKGCYSITDVTKTFELKRGQITKFAKGLGMLHKKIQEVNKKGEDFFKVYSTDGVHNQIGITETGLQWVRQNLDKIQMC